MHIAMVVYGDLRYDRRVHREATALVAAGHRVSIVASVFASDPLAGWEGIDVVAVPVDGGASLRLSYPRFWRRAHPLLRQLEADAYHAHDLDALLPAWLASRRGAVPLVYDSHEFFTEQSSLVCRRGIRLFWRFLESTLIRSARRVITVSPSIASALAARYGLHAVSVVRNVPEYQAPVASQRLRQRLALPATTPVVLYQGGLLTDNGLAEQIEAAGLWERGVLVLLGDGPCEPALRAQVEASGLGERVRFLPRVPFGQLHEHTCSADLGLCLIKGSGKSFQYSLPNKLFEYLMAGLPVLVSRFPEMERVVLATGAGRALDPADPRAVAAAVDSLLGDEPERRRQAAAATAAAREYNWEREQAHLLQVYEAL